MASPQSGHIVFQGGENELPGQEGHHQQQQQQQQSTSHAIASNPSMQAAAGRSNSVSLGSESRPHSLGQPNASLPSHVEGSSRGMVLAGLSASQPGDLLYGPDWQRKQALSDERDLLIDNGLWQDQSSRVPELAGSLSSIFTSPLKGATENPSQDRHDDAAASTRPRAISTSLGHHQMTTDQLLSIHENEPHTENTPLLHPRPPHSPSASLSSSSLLTNQLDETWNNAVTTGLIQTTWQREAKVLAKYTPPLILTFLLEYSLTVASIFAVGHIGKVELGAVSLASMTANISGYGVYEGWNTALDTLCAQAYGSGRKDLVGWHTQRMIWFTWALTLPIGVIWYNAAWLLKLIVPDELVCDLAGQYLRVALFGAPGIAAFKSGKRFMQAQGLFHAGMWVLLICAPLNALMNYLFVWKLGFGYIGAPMAVAVTSNLMPFCLFCYVYFVDGLQCWNGLSRNVFTDWGTMVSLALPGFVMIESEILAFEILALSASWLGTTELAAQTVLGSLSSITFEIPLPLSIAGSTRIANLIGAGLVSASRTTFHVMLVFSLFVGSFNAIVLWTARNYIPYLFTSDEEVASLVSFVLPLCASFQVVDALTATCNGTLRGLGRQGFGGWVQVLCYYVIAIPLSFICAFILKQGLRGTWIGVAIGLALVSVIESVYLYKFDWTRAVEEARKRNMV